MELHLSESIWQKILDSCCEANVDQQYLAFLQDALNSSFRIGTTEEIYLGKWAQLPGLCCQAAGGDPFWTIEISAAWLLFYLAADLMDSVEDEDEPDHWWEEYGAAAALNSASGLFFSASRILNSLNDKKETRDFASSLVDDFYCSFLRMSGGQHQDILTETISLDQYWKISKEKSGTFFALGARAGSRLATSNVDKINFYSQFGNHLGVLVQILDDLGDLKNIKRTLSQNQLSNLYHSLPIVYSLEVCSKTEREELLLNLAAAPEDDESAEKAVELIDRSGCELYILTELERHKNLAIDFLIQSKPYSPAKEFLIGFIQQLGKPS